MQQPPGKLKHAFGTSFHAVLDTASHAVNTSTDTINNSAHQQ
jgi:hypothetical protein